MLCINSKHECLDYPISFETHWNQRLCCIVLFILHLDLRTAFGFVKVNNLQGTESVVEDICSNTCDSHAFLRVHFGWKVFFPPLKYSTPKGLFPFSLFIPYNTSVLPLCHFFNLAQIIVHEDPEYRSPLRSINFLVGLGWECDCCFSPVL